MEVVQISESDARPLWMVIKADVRTRLLTGLMKTAPMISKDVKKVFFGTNSGVRDGEGEQWKPTSAAAIRARKSYPKINPTLWDTGALMKSVGVNDFDPTEYPDKFVMRVTMNDYGYRQERGFTTTVKNGVYGQGGKSIVVPPRQILFWTESDKQKINANIEEAFNA